MSSVDEEYKIYLSERHSLSDAEFRVSESLDKALLTLAGGGLAISMTFVTDIEKNPSHTWALVTAWAFFGSTIMVLLLTSYSCQLAYKKARDILDEMELARLNGDVEKQSEAVKGKNIWSNLTNSGNLASMGLFLLGLIFLGLFIWINMQTHFGE